MKLFGYSKKRLNADGLRSLNEVTLVADPDVFMQLSKFLQTEAKLMKKHKNDYGHRHFEYVKNGKSFHGLIISTDPKADA